MTGKLADTVMAVRNGEQIARKYQPVVYNPSTEAQVAQRAKLKLISQISAVMAPVIAIPKIGAVSSRNRFTKVNFPALTYLSNEAGVTLTDIQLTSSAVGLNEVFVTRGESVINAGIVNGAQVNADRVVYAAFAKHADKSLTLLGTAVANELGETFDWGVTFPNYNGEVVVYAYSVRDNTDAARAKFGNYETLTGETVATLLVTRTLTESDVTVSKTVSAVLSPVTAGNQQPTRKK